MKRLTVKRLFFILSIAIVFFLISEGLARLGFNIYNRKSFGPGVTFDAHRGWKWENKMFRNRSHFPKSKPDNVKRIVTMGDSCTWGAGVEDEETYSAKLQELLDRKVGSGRFEVMNAGTNGYGSFQIYLYLKQQIIDYHPDLVVIYANPYDYRGFGFRDTTLTSNSSDSYTVHFIQSVLFHSRIYYLLKRGIVQFRSLIHQENEEIILGETYLKKIHDYLEERNVKMVIVEYVSKVDGEILRERMIIEREWEAPLVHVYDAFSNSSLTPDELLLDRVHPSPIGHAIIAKEIFNTLLNNNLFDLTPVRQLP